MYGVCKKRNCALQNLPERKYEKKISKKGVRLIKTCYGKLLEV